MITNTMRMIINKRYTMKKVCFVLTIGVVMMMMGCGGQKNADNNADADSVEVMETPDSTVYGVCGSGTSMHSLELVTDEGDTIIYMLDADDAEMTVKGGMLVGDRMAVVGFKNSDGEMQASQAINITTLLGRWTSIDKNFEIQEGGIVESAVKAESNPWTAWKICNCKLILNRDTFGIEGLGADSLYLENHQGIYAFKRQPVNSND